MKASPVMSLKNMNEIISKNLPKSQSKANLMWLKHMHKACKEGGSWVYPDSGMVFIKKDHGFYFDMSKTPAGA